MENRLTDQVRQILSFNLEKSAKTQLLYYIKAEDKEPNKNNIVVDWFKNIYFLKSC